MAKLEASNVKGLMEKLFNVRPEEFKRVGVMFIYSLLAIGGSFVIGRTVSNALFLANLAEEYIPYRYIGMAIGITLAAVLFSRLSLRFKKVRMNLLIHGFMAAMMLLFRGLLYIYPKDMTIIALLYFFMEILGALVTIQFWTFASDVFHAREAKRLFGIIAAGGILSNVVAGAFVRTAAKSLGAPNLLWFIAAAMVGCIVCVYILRNEVEEKKEKRITTRKPTREKKTGMIEDFKIFSKSPQLISIAMIVAVTALVTNIADYQLSVVLRSSYSETQISAFFGNYYLICGIIASLIQFFFTGKALQRYGVLFALLLLPGAMMLGFLGTIFWISLFTIAPTRGADTVFRYTVNEATIKLLYLPVDTAFRPKATAIIDGMLKPISTGLAGVLFIFMRSLNVPLLYYSFLGIALLFIWIYSAVRAKRQYMSALANTLLSRKLDLEGASVNIDESTARVLIKALQHKSPGYILHALEIIKNTHKINWDMHIGHLLDHEKSDVRAAALNYMATQENTAHFSKILKLLDDEKVNVKAAAIRAVCALNSNYAMMAVNRYLKHENPEIKAVTIVGMIKHGGLDGILTAAGELKAMLEHHDWQMRMYGARVLGELNVQTFYHPLIKLINDGHKSVQKEAITAAGDLRSKHLMTLLIYKLADKDLQPVTTAALVKYGSIAQSALLRVLENKKENPTIRLAIPKVLQQIGGEENAQALLNALEGSETALRHNIITALGAIAKQDPKIHLEIKVLEKHLLAEARLFCELVAIEDDLRGYDSDLLIMDSLVNKRELALDRIFSIIQALYPEEDIAPIRRGLKSAKKQLRANAAEFLDILITDPHIKKVIIPIIEDMSEQKRAEVARELFEIKAGSPEERLAELLSQEDEWLRSVALYIVGKNKIASLEAKIEEQFASKSNIVQETALVALAKIIAPPQLTEKVKSLMQKEGFLVKEFAENMLKEQSV